MKQTILTAALVSILLGGIFVSCERDMNNVYPNKNSMEEKGGTQLQKISLTPEEYEQKYDKIVETIAYGLVNLSNNPMFRSIVNTEVAQQFDGDDNVLMKKLNAECNNSGINLKDEIINSLIQNGKSELIQYVEEAINGFDYFETKLYPQVYIPYIENKDLDQTPEIALNFNDEPILSTVKYNQQDGLGIIGTADETKAEQRLIWVISINESVTELGTLPTKNLPPIGIPFTPGVKVWKAKIKRINVQDKKEGWGNGRAEVCFVAYHIKPSCSPTHTTFHAQPLMKISNTGINQWFDPNAPGGCSACTLDGYLTDVGSEESMWEENEALPVIFYEQDRRDKFSKSDQLWPTCPNSMAYYSSKEDKYGIVYLNQNVNQWNPTALSFSIFSLAGIALEFEGGRMQ